MSLRREALTLFRKGVPDLEVRAILAGRATEDGLRSVLSKARRDFGVTLCPALCRPRPQQPRLKRARAALTLPQSAADAIAVEAAARRIKPGVLLARIVEAVVAGDLVSVVLEAGSDGKHTTSRNLGADTIAANAEAAHG